MQRNGVARLFVEPFFQDVHGLVDVSQHAVRQRQKPSRFPVLRSERDHLAVALGGFPGSLQRVEQDAQVGVRVDVLGIQLNGGAICGFRLERLSGRSQQHAEITVRIGVTRVDGDRTVDTRRSPPAACPSIGK